MNNMLEKNIISVESLEYHLDVLHKFEQLYQGEVVYFTEEDVPIAKKK